MNTQILSLSTLILLTFTSACDPVDSGAGDETCFDAGEAGGDSDPVDPDPETLEVRADSDSAENDDNDQSDQVCQLAPPPALEPMFVAGTCVHSSGIPLSDCRSGTALYRVCDSEYLAWCESQAGLVVVQTGVDAGPKTAASCGIGPGELPCDSEFFSECATQGIPTCDDPQECLSATCNEPQEGNWCCESTSGTGKGNGCVEAAGVGTCPAGHQIWLGCLDANEMCVPNGDGDEQNCTC